MKKILNIITIILAVIWTILTIIVMIPISIISLPALFKKRLYGNLLLFFLARFLCTGFNSIGLIYGLIVAEDVSKFLLMYAEGDDAGANKKASEFLNLIFLTKNSKDKFGDEVEFVTTNIQSNSDKGTLSALGLRITYIINAVDLNHIILSKKITLKK